MSKKNILFAEKFNWTPFFSCINPPCFFRISVIISLCFFFPFIYYFRMDRYEEIRDEAAIWKEQYQEKRERQAPRTHCLTIFQLVSISKLRQITRNDSKRICRPQRSAVVIIKARGTGEGMSMKSFTQRLRKVSTADRGTKKSISCRRNKKHFGLKARVATTSYFYEIVE